MVEASAIIATPIGNYYLGATEQGLHTLKHTSDDVITVGAMTYPDVIAPYVDALNAYFYHGEPFPSALKLNPRGTNFQRSVWAALLAIPYGETRSYKQIAVQIGSPKAVRAVGMANHRNPIAIVIPCHRVVGADGRLTGYAGGLSRKDWLLRWERQQSLNSATLSACCRLSRLNKIN